MIVGRTPLTGQERELWLSAIEESAATNRLEGLESSLEANQIFERYADGELSLDQMGAAIEELHGRKYGPLPLPRD